MGGVSRSRVTGLPQLWEVHRASNDKVPILENVGGATLNNARSEQLALMEAVAPVEQ